MRRLVLALLVLLTIPMIVAAAPPQGDGRFDLTSYDPPRFAVDVWLSEPNSATIDDDGRGFTMTAEFNGQLSSANLGVLADALDFAVELQEAMPQ